MPFDAPETNGLHRIALPNGGRAILKRRHDAPADFLPPRRAVWPRSPRLVRCACHESTTLVTITS